ncbi:LytTR family DNA-binding domain-containing protein [Dyadobacter sp. LHD-138]|uniref:LytR/AlgR family response regulator transcription factor n=1 Tax=Dyadobacter sp. LHD-138 TaxID=3071413 RepID=UPI0027E0838B|nr:LytTR family DNA-binding domain-containing protein [Dyadobacter sp. LHD-138]MDQ6480139.1 LytTR family DNA-binding domain-containing protein [Dyadobacter sp. LHD-138]
MLDIEMPDMSGTAFLSTLVNPPKVIIISAYEQYALQGYELNVTDYLLKPVSFARFLKSVNKVHDLMTTEKKHEDDYLFVKCEHKFKKLFHKDIVYVASMENYVVIHTATSKNIAYNTLRQIKDNLPAHLFIQTHRSYLVNLAFVKSIEGNELDLGAVKVPIARNLKDDVFNTIINSRLVVKK